MRIITAIASILISTSLLAQNRMLKPEAFRKTELSNEWIIVKYKSQATHAPQARPLHENKTPAKRSILDGVVKIPIPANQDPIAICNKLLEDPNVIYAEPIIENYLLETPTDPLLENQYYLDRIKAFDAWDITKGDDDITIAIIDSGTDLDHEDLASKMWRNENDTIDGIDNDGNGFIDDYFGYDFADNDNDPTADFDPHGTRVAGVAGAATDNDLGMAGVGYNTKIAALKGFSSTNGVSGGLFDAIMYAADNGIEVLNLSFGSIREPLQSEQDIINYAVLEKDVVVVAAAGNDGTKSTAEEKFYPASYDNVLSVAGSTSDDSKWSGSSYNHAVDLIAPASGILTTSNDDSYNTSTVGTSFASPMVAAAAALVKDQHPDLTAQQIMERVRVTADDIYEIGSNSNFEGKLGKGRLNVFRAVNEGNLKSLRAENIQIVKAGSDPIFYGDTLTISMDLTNYLGTVNDPAIYLTSPNNQFIADIQIYFPGTLGTFDVQSFSFEMILSDQLEPEATVDVRLDYQDGVYSDFQFIDLEIAPDYADFGNAIISVPIAGDGRIAIIDYQSGIGAGLVYQDDNPLANTGIMLATNANSVSDNIISDFESLSRDNDFAVDTYFKIQHHPYADRFARSVFTDAKNDLLIEQSNIASDTSEFIINRYRIVNTSTDTLMSLSFGVFADWDLSDPTANYAEFDLVENYLFARNSDSTLFAGTILIGDGSANYSALDLDEQNGNNQDLGLFFDDSLKFNYLIDQTILIAGSEGAGNDVAGLHGITFNPIPPNAFEYIDLIFAASNSKASLTNTFQEAQDYIDEYRSNPSILATVLTCNGGSTIIDPEDGEQYIFYSDALGTQVLDSTNAFAPTISSDTSFYVRNIDQSYPSEISEIRVRLFEEIASFSTSVDTLYLDHPTTNIIHFFDESVDAIAWSWDFGQGTQSTLQNPSISFNQEGTNQISLTVENVFGCVDTFMKELVVVSRPANLEFETTSLCPGQSTTLSHPTASQLFLYSTEFQLNSIRSGPEIQIGPFTSDTSIYIAGRVNGLMTNRTKVDISVQEILADIILLPDTLSAEFQIRAIAIKDENAMIDWIVNGFDAGTDNEILSAAKPGNNTFVLTVTTEECSVTIEKTFEISTTPTPEVDDLIGCAGETVILKPGNGKYFAFYDDLALTNLVSKGTQLEVLEEAQIFIVGLDDGLPGPAAQATITFEDFEPEIQFTSSIVGGKNRVEMESISQIAIQSFQWYIDGEKTDITPNPTFFFDDVEVMVVLEAESENGCIGTDTLNLDFTPPIIPLSVDGTHLLKIYPNPTSGIIKLTEHQLIDQISVKDIAGKELMLFDKAFQKIDLSILAPGLYILEAITDIDNQKIKIVIE